QAGVDPVQLGGFDETLPEVLEIRWDEQDVAGRLQDVEPFGYRWNRDPQWSREVRLVQDLSVAAGQERKEPPELPEILDRLQGSNIALEIRLDIGVEPDPRSPGAQHYLGKFAADQVP